jgi:hypothetical protein
MLVPPIWTLSHHGTGRGRGWGTLPNAENLFYRRWKAFVSLNAFHGRRLAIAYLVPG